MDPSRRKFLKNAAILSGAAGFASMLPRSIQRAMAINPAKGSSFYDAEHIVFLMQENRSFDHLFGSLRGVRGFNDPRAKTLPSQNKVWVQQDKLGNFHAPFHIDINKTKVTWQGGLPHTWRDQIGARNYGKYDKWIPFKSAMTMGYYDRSDVPFYYHLADAFTICDHYFCSSLTGTTPNRLFFWTGNIRPSLDDKSPAAVYNELAESRNDRYVDWSSFPELLEDHQISWKVYQNELWTAHLDAKTDYWLGNYGDNALEYIKRNHVKLAPYFRKNGDKTVSPHLSAQQVTANYHRLAERERQIIDKMFSNNEAQKDYLALTPYHFTDDKGKEQTVEIPKADIFYQFRKDVESGNLPTVSWLVAPEAFSDHTSTPLYGTWYVSEALDILTKDPEVWKKTIFILNYDENDGYFDHLPPFTPPSPYDNSTGKTSPDIDTSSDYHQEDNSPIGLGYRVPCIIASVWSKGGYVNSEVFDHCSTLMFVEHFLEKKTGKKIRSPHISSYRRQICGNLTSAFRPYNGEQIPLPDFEKKDAVINHIQNAKNKPRQSVPTPLTKAEVELINQATPNRNNAHSLMASQEPGTRPACALPYHPKASLNLQKANRSLILQLDITEQNSGVGIPLNMYTPESYNKQIGKNWNYALSGGTSLTDQLALDLFENQTYHLCLHGPNGFFRQFIGDIKDPDIEIHCDYEKKLGTQNGYTGNLIIMVQSLSDHPTRVSLKHHAYTDKSIEIRIENKARKLIMIDLQKSSGWYDFSIIVEGNETFERRYAGHVETGKESISDPYMGGLL